MKLLGNPNHFLTRRIRFLLGYKNIPYECIHNTDPFPTLELEGKNIVGNTLSVLRDIEYAYPHPIAFIGPVEARVQWASMILSSTPGFQKLIQNETITVAEEETFTEIFEGIAEMVEDEYFVMGPTFSVADCVLAADLSMFPHLPEVLRLYIDRVSQKTNTESL